MNIININILQLQCLAEYHRRRSGWTSGGTSAEGGSVPSGVRYGDGRVPTVRESRGILSESGKVRENREGQGKVREF